MEIPEEESGPYSGDDSQQSLSEGMLGEGGDKMDVGILEYYFNSFAIILKMWGFVNLESVLLSLFTPPLLQFIEINK